MLDAVNPKGRRYYWKSEYLQRIEPALCEKLIEHAAKIQSPHSAEILVHLSGELNRVKDDHSPVGNREARYILNLAAAWERAEADMVNMEWARQAWTDMRRFSTGGTYINFLTEDEGLERIQAVLGDGLDRLAKIKAKWDPQNVFRTNRNIKPAG